MSPFFRAREAALDLRARLMGEKTEDAISSTDLLACVESCLKIGIQGVTPTHKILKGADATLRRKENFIYYRKDVSPDEQAYLIAHELGHYELDKDLSPIKRISSAGPVSGSVATTIVESYGAHERDELQKNVFGRELLLPRVVARKLFTNGMGPKAIAKFLCIPIEVARQQVLDGVLLPEYTPLPPPPLPPPSQDQNEAINATEKYVNVVAGPGTGKTTTLIHRIKKLIEIDGVDPKNILVLTFTNKAAAELVDRLQRTGLKGASEIWAGTFHAFGLEFLRKYYQFFDLDPDVVVADRLTQLTVVARTLANVELKHYRRTDDPYEWLPPVIDVARRLKEELITIEHYLVKAIESSQDENDHAIFKDIATVANAYEKSLRREKLVDFVDLIAIPATSIAKNRTRFKDVSEKYEHVLVDEFQDLTTAMIELVNQLSLNSKSLWVVGDIRQAIYHWRGASLHGLLKFEEKFKGAQLYSLVTNQRSVEEVIKVTAQVGVSHRLQETMPLADPKCSRGVGGEMPILYSATGFPAMWKSLIDQIRTKVRDNVPYKDQVVLARKSATVSSAAKELQKQGIPTLYIGELLDRPEIKDLLAVVQLVVERVPRAFLRVADLCRPATPLNDVRSIVKAVNEDTSLSRLMWLGSNKIPLSDSGTKSLKFLRSKLQGFSWSTTPWEFLCELVLERRFLLPDLSDQTIDGHLRRIALWQFAYMSRTGDGERKRPTLYRFLARLRLRQQLHEPYIDRDLPPEANALDGVRVMTIHASKGLEFGTVHLCAANGIDFSGANAVNQLMPPECINSTDLTHQWESDIECNNLLYVAVSRSRNTLFIYDNPDEYPFQKTRALYEGINNRKIVFKQLPAISISSVTNVVHSNAVKKSMAYEELLSYDRCKRQYFYQFGLGLGVELAPNSALQARGAVRQTLKSIVDSGKFDQARAIFDHIWQQGRLPEAEADPQLFNQAWSACMAGATYLQTIGGKGVSASAELNGTTLQFPWGVGINDVGGIRLHVADFFPRSKLSVDRISRLLGQMMYCTNAFPLRIVGVTFFDLNRRICWEAMPLAVYKSSMIMSLANGLMQKDYTPSSSTFPCRRCSYLYVCPSMPN